MVNTYRAQPLEIANMNAGLNLGQEQGSPRPATVTTTKDIPYDYVAKFKLHGRAGNRVQDVISISTEGSFVAVAIGYSFIPAKLPPLPPLPSLTTQEPRPTSTVDMLTDWLLDVFQLPSFALGNNPQPLPSMLLQSLLVQKCGIDFKYSIVDSGSGRELQNQPIHNIAGLGEASGDRPFRPLAKPMQFMPRSTIRIEVEEVSEGPIYGYQDANKQRIGAELYIVLHGYKMLGHGI